jgi:hypothetical protein
MFGAHMRLVTGQSPPTALLSTAMSRQDHGVLLGTKVRGRAAYGELVTHMLVATDSSARLGAMTTLTSRPCDSIRTLAGLLVDLHSMVGFYLWIPAL